MPWGPVRGTKKHGMKARQVCTVCNGIIRARFVAVVALARQLGLGFSWRFEISRRVRKYLECWNREGTAGCNGRDAFAIAE